MVSRGLFTLALTLPLTGASPNRVNGQETGAQDNHSLAPAALSAEIDQLLQPELPGIASPPAPDGILLRRLSLDLRGVVPTREELDAFAADPAPERWSKWVDRFLQDPLCDEHLVQLLDRTLMLRRKHTHVDRATWVNYLREQVAAETSLDALSKALLYSPWWNQQHRAEQRFYLDRDGEPHLITRDLGRVFLGRDMQCAQCHDHPLIDDYRQIDYHGLLAFVTGGSLVQATYKDAEQKDQKLQLYVEKAAGDTAFESVFEVGKKLRSATRLFGQAETIDPYLPPDQRYVDQAPEGALAGIEMPPKQSRRQQLAERLASRDNEPFVANWANRLWASVFGRGLVHPVDMMGPDNPPTHPQLFKVITDGLRASDMKIKPFLRQLVLTDAYRRGGKADWIELGDQADDPAVIPMRQTLEQRLTTIRAEIESCEAIETERRSAYDAAREAWLNVQADRTTAGDELDKAEAAMVAAKKKHDETVSKLDAAKKNLSAHQSRVALLDESASKLTEALAFAEGDDAELSKAIELAKKIANDTRGQIAGLEKTAADAQVEVDKTAPPLQQATAAVEAASQKLQPIEQSVLAADLNHVEARAGWTDAQRQLVAARRSLFRLEHWSQWLAEKDRARELSQTLLADSEQWKAGQAAEREAQLAVDATRQAVAAAENSMKAASQSLDHAQQALTMHRETLQTLQAALASLESATKLVDQTETLLAAQDSLRQSIGAKQMQLGELQTAVDTAQKGLTEKSTAREQKQTELDGKLALLNQAQQQLVGLQKSVEEGESQLAGAQATIQSQTQTIADEARVQLATAELTPLTPEQLCLSTLRITGVLDAYIRNAAAELEKNSPLPQDADQRAKEERQRQAVRVAIDKLRGNIDLYVSLYGSGSDKTQDDFFASADQALYIANGGSVYSWAAPGNNNPTQAAIAMEDPTEIAKTLYWAYLCRQPSETEIALVSQQLAEASDQRSAVIQEMAWSLLASAEFRFAQ